MDFYSESENVKHLKSFYDAVARGDFTAARQYLDPSLEWSEPEAPGLWFGGTHRGPDAVFKEVIEPAYGKIANFQVKLKKFYEVGEHVVVLGRFRGRTKMTGKDLDAPTAHIWTLRAGKAVRFQSCQDIARWLEALSEKPPQAERLAA
jgi:ketosteroid isomerase-like protein